MRSVRGAQLARGWDDPGRRRRPRRRPLGVLAAAGVLAATLLVGAVGTGVVTVAAPRAAPAECRDVTLFAVNGSGATGGDTLAAVTDPLVQQVGERLAVVAVAGPEAGASYEASEQQAVATLTDQVAAQLAACPQSRAMLFGYSQGAHVAGDVAARIGAGQEARVPADRILAVGLFGDPARSAGVRTVPADVTGQGILPAREGGFGALAARTIEVCAPQDPVCATAAGATPPPLEQAVAAPSHIDYPQLAVAPDTPATRWASESLSRLITSLPAAGGPASGTPAGGAPATSDPAPGTGAPGTGAPGTTAPDATVPGTTAPGTPAPSGGAATGRAPAGGDEYPADPDASGDTGGTGGARTAPPGTGSAATTGTTAPGTGTTAPGAGTGYADDDAGADPGTGTGAGTPAPTTPPSTGAGGSAATTSTGSGGTGSSSTGSVPTGSPGPTATTAPGTGSSGSADSRGTPRSTTPPDEAPATGRGGTRTGSSERPTAGRTTPPDTGGDGAGADEDTGTTGRAQGGGAGEATGALWALTSGLAGFQDSNGGNVEGGGLDPEEVESPNVPGRRVVKLEVPGGAKRSEVRPEEAQDIRAGEHLFFGYSAFLPDDFPVDTSDWQVIWQLHDGGTNTSPPVALEIVDGHLWLANVGDRVRDLGPVQAGRNLDVQLDIRFEEGGGSVSVYRGGQQVLQNFRPPRGTMIDSFDYLKTGIYRHTGGPAEPATIFLNDLKIGDTLASVSGLAGAESAGGGAGGAAGGNSGAQTEDADGGTDASNTGAGTGTSTRTRAQPASPGRAGSGGA